MVSTWEFVAFTLTSGGALSLAIGYSLLSIRRLDDLRPLALVGLLGLMTIHQGFELYQFYRGTLSTALPAEVAETSANLLASLVSYFLLGFLREEQQLNDRLREREADLRRTRRAIDASGHAVYVTDADWQIEYVNPAFEEITGYAAAEVRGEHPHVLHPDGDDGTTEDRWAFADPTTIREVETVFRRKDGEQYHARQTTAPITGDDGEIQGFVAIQTDITDRKRLEADLRESLRQLRVFDRILRHNFHNDVNVIRGYAELVLSSAESDTADYAETIVDKSDELLHTVEGTRDHDASVRSAVDRRRRAGARRRLRRRRRAGAPPHRAALRRATGGRAGHRDRRHPPRGRGTRDQRRDSLGSGRAGGRDNRHCRGRDRGHQRCRRRPGHPRDGAGDTDGRAGDRAAVSRERDRPVARQPDRPPVGRRVAIRRERAPRERGNDSALDGLTYPSAARLFERSRRPPSVTRNSTTRPTP